jgi:hypothetical protein
LRIVLSTSLSTLSLSKGKLQIEEVVKHFPVPRLSAAVRCAHRGGERFSGILPDLVCRRAPGARLRTAVAPSPLQIANCDLKGGETLASLGRIAAWQENSAVPPGLAQTGTVFP